MDLHITLSGRGGLTAQLYRQILDAILDGRLRPGDQLPPTRELAGRLRVARTTVTIAYERLTAEGYLVARQGSGTFVSRAPVRRAAPDTALAGEALASRDVWEELPRTGLAETAPATWDFGIGVPDGDLFPLEAWRRSVGRELRTGKLFAGGYADAGGHRRLREGIARHVGLSRSVRCEADDVLITDGAQHAFDLIGRVMIEPGTVVAVEEPGYPPVRHLFRSLGAVVVGVPVDDEGLVIDALPHDARIVYVTPSHQFPLGTVMSLGRRLALLRWAEDREAAIIEDDYDSEFRFKDRPLEPLQRLDRQGWVLYVGTFSKILHPALRLGFVIAPESVQEALRAARRLTDWHGSLLTQAAMARFIDDGHLATHLRRATRIYRERHGHVLAGLGDELSEWLEPVPSVAGIHVAARVRPDMRVDLDAVLVHARAAGVSIGSLSEYVVSGSHPPGLVIGYGSIAGSKIRPGLQRLEHAFRSAV